MFDQESDILAQALGRMLLQYAQFLDPADLAAQIRRDAEKCLVDIAKVLDRTELDDAQCIEEIVSLLEAMGLHTSRHDFG